MKKMNKLLGIVDTKPFLVFEIIIFGLLLILSFTGVVGIWLYRLMLVLIILIVIDRLIDLHTKQLEERLKILKGLNKS